MRLQLGLTLTFATLAAASALADSLLFRGGNVFDGEKLHPGVDVLVTDGKIADLGPTLAAPAGCETIDAAGCTLLPGLIDCHTHSFAPPQLAQALVFGVTTQLEMFTVAPMMAAFQSQQRDNGAPGRADIYSAGVLVTAPGGHGTQFGTPIPTITKPDEAEQFVADRIKEGSDYIKIVLEDGSAIGMKFNCISNETLVAVVRAAHKQGKLAVVHVTARERAREAILAGADGLVHTFCDQAIDEELVKLAKDKGAFVIPTLTVKESIAGIASGESLTRDARLQADIPLDASQSLTSSFPASGAEKRYIIARESVTRWHAAGVPILAGTDAPNPGTSHGVSMHRELELLVAAGLTPPQALAAATSLPAAKFKLADRGRIAKGLRADMLLVRGDPTKSIESTREIVGVWKLGKAAPRSAHREQVAKARAEAEKVKLTPPPAGSESGVISDFESDQPAANFGTAWQASTDAMMGGKSTVEFKVVSPGANGSKGALEIKGKIAEGQSPWAGVIQHPAGSFMAPANLSKWTKFTFQARADAADARCSILLFTKSGGFRPAMHFFKIGKDWTSVEVPFAKFNGSDGADVTGIYIGGAAGEYTLWLDDVRME